MRVTYMQPCRATFTASDLANARRAGYEAAREQAAALVDGEEDTASVEGHLSNGALGLMIRNMTPDGETA